MHASSKQASMFSIRFTYAKLQVIVCERMCPGSRNGAFETVRARPRRSRPKKDQCLSVEDRALLGPPNLLTASPMT